MSYYKKVFDNIKNINSDTKNKSKIIFVNIYIQKRQTAFESFYSIMSWMSLNIHSLAWNRYICMLLLGNKMQIFYVYAQSAETTVEITNTTTGGCCYTDSLGNHPWEWWYRHHVEGSRQRLKKRTVLMESALRNNVALAKM